MKEKVEQILTKILGEKVVVEQSPEEHGDYSSNIAFLLAKKERKNPVEVASEIKEKIKSPLFSKIEVKNGFLNFFISDEELKKEILLVLKEKENYKRGVVGKTVVVDYSSPNIAKPFGVGHLRSTIIGQSLYNIYHFLGWKTVGINHLGDWGTQYGKLLSQIKKENKNPENLSIKDLEELYVRFHTEAEIDKKREEEGRAWFSKLEKGDKEARRIWEICKKKSLEEFDKVYQDLDVKIDHIFGESFYEEMLPDIIKEAKEKKIAKESNGALIIEFDDMPPAMILKSDGSTTYLTRDLAAAKYRLKTFFPDLFIYEVGADQVLHLRQLFATIEKLGWAKKEKFYHVPHGMFRLKEGKFSTRKGRTVHLEEVLSLAKEKATEMINNSTNVEGLSGEEKKEIARIVGVGAVKYNDLKRHHKRDVIFEWDQVLAIKGDAGPYLQYTCVRCKSILEKAGKYTVELSELNEEEKRVVKRISQFEDVINLSAKTFSPNIIAEYAHKLSKEFNIFYDNCPIMGNNQRLAITEATYIILKQCLFLLTISVPDKM
jgi:arginyl-tRNA synthetase